MVRLRVIEVIDFRNFIIFQSQYGTIKSTEVLLLEHAVKNFNPSMVRLRESKVFPQRDDVRIFQSQYGTIKRSRS